MTRWKARGGLPIGANCIFLALMAAALLSKICRNRRFPTGVGHFERKF